MINYADYAFYQNVFVGSLSLDLFNSLIFKASREIDKAVNKNLQEEDIDDKVRFVTCQLVDYMNTFSYSAISSISIDSVSKTQKGMTEINQDKIEILNGLPNELTRCL